MGGLSPLHWILIIAVALLVFGGRGKLSGLMGDAAKGIKAFKEGLKDEDAPKTDAEPVPSPVLPRVDPEKEPVKR
jgi:sec-independent protein translocase protein TatA